MARADRTYARLREYGPLIRREVLKRFRPDSSIAAVRTGSAFLATVGLDNYILSVQLSIYNRATYDRAHREGGLPVSRSVSRRWARESGAWSVGLGYPATGPMEHWPGHAVLIVERRWLWDLAIDQANRPDYAIVFHSPPVLGVSEAFLRGREQATGWWDNCLLLYDAKPDDKTHRTSPDWDADISSAMGEFRIRRAVEEMERGKK